MLAFRGRHLGKPSELLPGGACQRQLPLHMSRLSPQEAPQAAFKPRCVAKAQSLAEWAPQFTVGAPPGQWI